MDRSANVRLHDFLEVDVGLTAGEAKAEAERCLQCKKPSCVAGCPVCIDIPAFIAHIAEGEFLKAAAKIKEQNMLPAICGRVCPQEDQCEAVCILGKKEKPIMIGQLERFVADAERKAGMKLPEMRPKTGKRVAVIGSGPAGLTASAELAKAGHSVVLFESLHQAGGVLSYGIPAFRLPKDIVQAEIEQVLSMGVELRLNHLCGRSVTPEELLGFDAVLLGTGAGLPAFMGIPGEHLNGVYSANEFLTRVNLMHANLEAYDTPVAQPSRVVVIGGGNVAMDAARTARRMGALTTLVYRRRDEDLPARQAEIEHAREEGVEFICCANPVRILGEQVVTGVECAEMEMCELDGSGRPRPKAIEGKNFTLDCDVVIQAIGQSPNPVLLREMPRLSQGRSGILATDEMGRTSIPKIFAAGDIATGAATVILAMGGAKKAAAAITEMLSGR